MPTMSACLADNDGIFDRIFECDLHVQELGVPICVGRHAQRHQTDGAPWQRAIAVRTTSGPTLVRPVRDQRVHRFRAIVAPDENMFRCPLKGRQVSVLHGLLKNLTAFDVEADPVMEQSEPIEQVPVRLQPPLGPHIRELCRTHIGREDGRRLYIPSAIDVILQNVHSAWS